MSHGQIEGSGFEAVDPCLNDFIIGHGPVECL
jgi:hypothetical protein